MVTDVFLGEGRGCESLGIKDTTENSKPSLLAAQNKCDNGRQTVNYFLNKYLARYCVTPNQPSKHLTVHKLIEYTS